MDTFGEWVRTERGRRRLTREELARRVGCSVAMLRKIESDERRPSAQIAELIANAFDIPAGQRPTFVRVARGELATDRLPAGPAPARGAPASPAAAHPRNNLPVFPTPLIGRERELRQLADLVRDPECRLVTLVGPGGIGKTRLAAELATGLATAFPDGAYFVPLAPASSPRFLVPIIADSIGFAFQGMESGDAANQLVTHCREKQMLLLLDNVEQLLREPGIEILSELLASAHKLKLLATSREPLNLRDEWVFEVGGLPVPRDPHGAQALEGTSVELFLQRARRADAGFDAKTSDYPAIVRICQLADGMPLAIELAASWVRTLSCEEIADEIRKSLDFLSAAARDLPPRHRSVRVVFDHSWSLLSVEEQSALAHLSVFRGGFGRDAAQQVAGALLRMLSTLVAKSLVRRTGEARYDLHELIRQYAEAKLDADSGLAAAARHRHYEFFLVLAEASTIPLKGAGQMEWLRRLEQEHDNFRAALEWSGSPEAGSTDGQGLTTLRLAGALGWFWQMRCYYQEGRDWLLKALRIAPEQEADRASPAEHEDSPAHQAAEARALVSLALLDNSLGHHAAAHALAERGAAYLRLLGDKQGLGEALVLIGQTLHWQGEVQAGHRRLEEALSLFRETGDEWNAARTLYHLGTDLADWGTDASGRRLLEESASILEKLGDKFILVRLLVSRGILAFGVGDYAQATAHFQRSLVIAQAIRDPWGMADALTNAGCVLRVQGDYPGARAHFEQALKVYQEWGRGPWCADALCALAENEIAQGQLSSASSLLEDAACHAGPSENRWLHVLVGYFQGLLAFHLGDTERAVDALLRTIDTARASQYKPDLARALVTLGRVLGARGETERAKVATSEGLVIFSESSCSLGIATALETFAGLAPAEKAERATRLLGTAQGIRAAIGAPLPPIDRPAYAGLARSLNIRLGQQRFARVLQAGQQEPCDGVVKEVLATLQSAHPDYFAPPVSPAMPAPRPATALGSA